MILETERLILRDVKKGDEKEIRENINNLNVSRYLLVVPFPYSKKQASDFVKHCINEARKKPRVSYEFGIELKESGKIAGLISITKINWFRGVGMIGYWLGEKYWRRGIMSEALKEIINFSFKKLKLRRIDISAAVPNEASNGLIKKIGFIYEGMRRKRNRVESTGRIYEIGRASWRERVLAMV